MPRTAATWPWGAGAQDLEGLGGGQDGFAAQGAADEVDEGVGEMGEVADGFLADLAVAAEGAAEQVSGVGAVLVAAGSSNHMNWVASAWHTSIIKHKTSKSSNS